MINDIVPPTGIYLIKVCVYILAFYFPFSLFLRHTTFFTLNRIFLVSGLLLSFVLPLYTGPVPDHIYEQANLLVMEPLLEQKESVVSRASEPAGMPGTAILLVAIYFLGVFLRLIRMISSLAGIIRLKQRGESEAYDGVRVVNTDTPIPFAFLSYVFMPGWVRDSAILHHEAAHVRQYHWIDLLIAEAASIILWFNPVMIFYNRSLKQQHEYLADQSAIQSGIDLGKYLASIRNQIERTISTSLVSEFHFKSIKSRINMLTRKKTPVFVSVSYATVLPIILFGLTAFSPKRLPGGRQDQIQFTQDPMSFAMPIDKEDTYTLESGYGERVHPVLGVTRMHTGIDMVAESGVPVVSAEAGTVVKAEFLKMWGNIIVVRHNDTYATSYSHLKSMAVREGDEVRKGQVIGQVGNTGLSGRNHLHFELLRNDKAIDPMTYLPPSR